MTEILLTAAMIVRDEEPVLHECLQSIRDIVDEIVVVDTGSTDDSRSVARRYGARVSDVPWNRDFAAPRNEALNRSRGRWILYIDADERLRDADRPSLRDMLANATAVAYTVRFRPQTGFTRYREYRIFRNDPRIRFSGVIHETMLPAILDVAVSDGLRIEHSPLAIDHVGYDGDQRRKHVRNIPLLRQRLETSPGHVYAWHHLGRALAGLGDGSGAENAWQRGMDAVRRGVHPGPLDSLPYVALIGRRIEQGVDANALLDEAEARFPASHLLVWLRGRALMADGRFEEAIPFFERLAAIDADTLCEDAISYDARMFGSGSFEALALCHFRLERFEESAAYYDRALAETGADPQYRVKRDLAMARAGRARRLLA